MAKSVKRIVDNVVTMPAEKSATSSSTESIADAIVRRAFELYRARGCEHGHDVDDWLNAEQELRVAATSSAA
jgi:hypothetical protein